MGDILPFKRPKTSTLHKGNSLCRHGHHKWRVVADSVFDVKLGKLVTKYACERCRATRTSAE